MVKPSFRSKEAVSTNQHTAIGYLDIWCKGQETCTQDPLMMMQEEPDNFSSLQMRRKCVSIGRALLCPSLRPSLV